ncbi:uncharacterized protein KY384_005668 [Bacidia gigantensis]|uniref:uncharacterized protein n=1 Tax=Bacidia gigantensis TaxID=2732470 RepID=UPI001D039BC6|nr:uncharacterized protein KY384_005668 [Bacidia gigantensis]KAG8529034.1 hypothetical protein KY384_005668 [Bacidia gigantensis]
MTNTHKSGKNSDLSDAPGNPTNRYIDNIGQQANTSDTGSDFEDHLDDIIDDSQQDPSFLDSQESQTKRQRYSTIWNAVAEVNHKG